MEYTVYILYSLNFNKIYVGYTSNLIERFKSHNTLNRKGWTKNFRPWVIIYVEIFFDKKQALIREKQLKSGQGRLWVKQKIKKEFHLVGFISA